MPIKMTRNEYVIQDSKGIFLKDILGKVIKTKLIMRNGKFYYWFNSKQYLLTKTNFRFKGIPIFQVNAKSVSLTKINRNLKKSLSRNQKSRIYGKLHMLGISKRRK